MEIANEIGVSDASIIRFSKAIGFEGYAELKNKVYDMLVENSSNKISLTELMRMNYEKMKGVFAEMKEMLFFDIDGTLVDFSGQILPSTLQALCQARKAGHELILCTGRSKHQINQTLLDFGFDGIVAAAGGYAEYKGEVVFHKSFGEKGLQQVVDAFHGSTPFVLQRAECTVMAGWMVPIFFEVYSDDRMKGDTLKSHELFRGLMIDDDIKAYADKYSDTDSLVYCRSPYTVEEVRGLLGEGIHVEMSSYISPEPYSGEITIEGVDKGMGIRKLLEYSKVPREMTIGFGDGANDIGMFQITGKAVVMGNALDSVKKYADYVTDDVDRDGIANAFKVLFDINA